MQPPTTAEERYTLEMIAGSYEVRNEREEPLWRAFIETFNKNYSMQDHFIEGEVISAYRAFLRALLSIDRASRLLDT